MKTIKLTCLSLLLLSLTACSAFKTDVFSINDDNELKMKRQKWAQFEEKRTEKELSNWQ